MPAARAIEELIEWAKATLPRLRQWLLGRPKSFYSAMAYHSGSGAIQVDAQSAAQSSTLSLASNAVPLIRGDLNWDNEGRKLRVAQFVGSGTKARVYIICLPNAPASETELISISGLTCVP